MSENETPEKREETAAHESQEIEEVISVSSADVEDEGLPEGPGFMALYTTLMLLMMTFFIVLITLRPVID